ncbi:dihydroorotate dehydrogenase B catalytic subunit [Candidatus Roizmanbacteria bacterium CG11_big_fil_rev_8_21_14_0_20_36_8]|uniref:Dihydroorotate dehydrogenase n=1 Tax=Candidatus Roizmanbacteria bacterium CG11_big_fil_rev_8_21_14_0_20_36_8 TaxID=1974856 RepID=A0A2M6IUP0_9BACT|nr:MAG: dihydroorotate dehydrogenase B catalytic subunit [Candidatus Roizmanbacteria bacterium CG11_big_fil_rev_8_21_14_0_20_36_8]
MIDLSVNFAGIQLRNPTILASGIMGVSVASLKYCEESGAGAVTCKSIGHAERMGHHNPTVYSWGQGLTNAVGLSNQGVDEGVGLLKEMIETLNVPVIASCFADTVDNIAKVAEKLIASNPVAIELNLSCPNTENDFGLMFALDTDATTRAVSQVKKIAGKTKVFVKLTPDASNIVDVGKAAEAAGADALTAANTLSGMIIDIHTKRPILTNKFGGLSGPAIKPVSVRAVYNLYKAVKIPIIGTGGINTGEDAIEFIMAGAAAVGIGSGIYYRGIDIFKKVTDEISEFMEKNNYRSIEEMKGMANI